MRAEVLEAQLAAYMTGFTLSGDYVEVLVREYDRQRRRGDLEIRRERIVRELERWRRLFVLGDIEEGRYLSATKPLRTELRSLGVPQERVHLEQAGTYLREFGTLYLRSSPICSGASIWTCSMKC